MSNVALLSAAQHPSCAESVVLSARDRERLDRSRANRKERRRTQVKLRSWIAGLAACGLVLSAAAPAAGAHVCKPLLMLQDVRLSDMQPPTLERRWSAIVSADARHCATTAGYFEVGISRWKENSPDLTFREQFVWSSPAAKIEIDFAPDEAVGQYWVDRVQACPCAQ